MNNPNRADLTALTALTLVLVFLLAVVFALPEEARVAGLGALAAVLGGVARVLAKMKK